MVIANRIKLTTPLPKAAPIPTNPTFGIRDIPAITPITLAIAATTPIQPTTNRTQTIIVASALKIGGIS